MPEERGVDVASVFRSYVAGGLTESGWNPTHSLVTGSAANFAALLRSGPANRVGREYKAMNFGDAIAGFLLGLSLIVAIGAQNLFVLRQGVRGAHVFAVCLTCALSDALLIAVGVGGFSLVAQSNGWVEPVLRYAGAVFLIGFGLLSARNALSSEARDVAMPQERQTLGAAIAVCLALTWLNPHVYLDTVVLLGTVSTQYDSRLSFAVGAMTATFVFFFSLGFGARRMRGLFARPTFARALDASVALIVWGIAAKLVVGD